MMAAMLSESTFTGEFGELRIVHDIIEVTSNLPRTVPRLTSYYLNDEPITEERAQEIIATARGGRP